MLVVTVNYNISVNNFGAKKSAHFNCALVLTEVESFKRNAVYKLLHGTISENTEVSREGDSLFWSKDPLDSSQAPRCL